MAKNDGIIGCPVGLKFGYDHASKALCSICLIWQACNEQHLKIQLRKKYQNPEEYENDTDECPGGGTFGNDFNQIPACKGCNDYDPCNDAYDDLTDENGNIVGILGNPTIH